MRHFPFKENSIDGVITGLSRIKPVANFIEANVTKLFSSAYGVKCVDRNADTYCHTGSNGATGDYLFIHFLGYKVKMTGYSMQNRKGESGYWNPLTWVLKGSNNFIDFQQIDTQGMADNNANCAAGIIRSFQKTSTSFFSYFMLQTTGKNCQKNNVFNLAEFEVFGYLKKDIAASCSGTRHSMLYIFLSIFLFVK